MQMIVVFPMVAFDSKPQEGVPCMNVMCIACKRSCDLPDTLVEMVAELAHQDPHGFAFVCEDCMQHKTEKVAGYVLEKTVFKNAHSN